MTDTETPKRRLAVPLLFSAIFPGLGQLVQKRWLAAAGYGLTALAEFCWFSAKMKPVLDAYLQIVSDPEHAQAPAGLEPAGMLFPALVTLAIYIASIGDVVRGARPVPPPPPAV